MNASRSPCWSGCFFFEWFCLLPKMIGADGLNGDMFRWNYFKLFKVKSQWTNEKC